MASILDLPAELVLQILSSLTEREPHSIKHLHEEPSEALLHSEYSPIKNLSLTCRRLRTLCLQTLFTNVKLTLTSLRLSVVTERTIAFIQDHDLVKRIESVLFYQVASTVVDNEHDCRNVPRCTMESQILWVISQLNPSTITIMLPPSSFQELMHYDLRESDDWAFQTPYQVLHLTQATDMDPVPYPEGENPDIGILNILPWRHCTFNEGSSVRAYNTYQYSEKHVPSIFTPINEQKMVNAVRMTLPYLTSLDYVAVFPFSDRHMELFCKFCMAAAPDLARLRTRFSPPTGNRVLDDKETTARLRTRFSPPRENRVLDDKETMEAYQGTDMRSELENCYRFLSGWLGEGLLEPDHIVVLDYDNDGLRDAIHRIFRDGAWAYDENGKWIKLA